MAETVLLLARHGATQANICQPYTLQGLRPDNPLAEVGMRQARAAAAALQAFPITRIYCSPLRRARHTAEVIVGRLAAPLMVDEGLVEADVGLWSGLSWEEIEQRWPQEHRAFRDAPERSGYLGGENLGQVRDRVLPVIEAMAALHRGETVLVVGHGVVIRVLTAHWLGLPLCYARTLPLDNGGFNVVEVRNGVGRVRTVNQSVHLAGLLAPERGASRKQASHSPPKCPR
jgi:broad specificity phosphatase PhoE